MKRSKLSKEKYLRSTGSEMELSPVFKETNRLSNGINGVTSGQDPIQLSFPIFKKELKKSLEAIVVHTFNPRTQKADTGGSLSLRPTWSRSYFRTAKLRQ